MHVKKNALWKSRAIIHKMSSHPMPFLPTRFTRHQIRSGTQRTMSGYVEKAQPSRLARMTSKPWSVIIAAACRQTDRRTTASVGK